MKVLNFGSLNIDKVYSVNNIVKKSETLSVDQFNENIGGKGLNQSIAIRRGGIDLYHAGAIGSDGNYLKEILASEGIDTRFIETLDDVSGHAIIQVDANGDNSIIVYGGSNKRISNEEIDHVLGNFEKGDALVIQNEISNVAYLIKQAHVKGMTVFFNPSPINAALKDYPIELIDFLILNEVEGESLTGKKTISEILDALIIKYPNTKIVLTLGENGSVYADKNMRINQAAYPVKVVDTSGAGDTFTGYLIASILKGKSIAESLELASISGAIAASRHGTSASIPSIEEVLSFKENINKGEKKYV